jgi:hypothetical protein
MSLTLSAQAALRALVTGMMLREAFSESDWTLSGDFDALLPKNSPLNVLNCSAFLVDGWKTGIVLGLRSAKIWHSFPQRGLSLWGPRSWLRRLSAKLQVEIP